MLQAAEVGVPTTECYEVIVHVVLLDSDSAVFDGIELYPVNLSDIVSQLSLVIDSFVATEKY